MRRGLVMWSIGLALLFARAAIAQGWTAFSPEGGRYRVDIPGAPKVNIVPISFAGESAPMTEAVMELPGAAYLVSHTDYPDRIAMAHAADSFALIRP